MKNLVPLLLFITLLSCHSMKQSKNITTNNITISLTECGSYEVKNKEKTIGYVVDPDFIEESVNLKKELSEFEQKLSIQYPNRFKKKLRIYSFTLDRAGDTILITTLLSLKQCMNIPNCKCELQAVDVYPRKAKDFYYNCSKNRFKISGDPD